MFTADRAGYPSPGPAHHCRQWLLWDAHWHITSEDSSMAVDDSFTWGYDEILV